MATLIPGSSTPEPLAGKLRSNQRQVLRQLLRSRTAVLGAIVAFIFLVMAIAGPSFVPYDPYKMSLGDRLQEASTLHWFGTDEMGRDLFSRIIVGSRISLLVSFSGTLLALLTGMVLGTVAGYYRGNLDAIIMRSMDVLLAFPGILLGIVVMAALGTSLTNLVIAVGIHSIPVFARLAYGSTLSTKECDYVLAARTIGAEDLSILFRHILPNILSPLMVQASLRVGSVILMTAGLGFLGLGVQPPLPEWGTMLSDARSYMRSEPHVSFYPGLMIFFAVLGFNLLGDGLRDALDPRLRSA